MPSSGLVVASRLAENKSVSIAVIEAGPNAENLQEVLPFIPLFDTPVTGYPSLGFRSWPHRNWPIIHYIGLVISNCATS
jgi:hypothetical protein